MNDAVVKFYCRSASDCFVAAQFRF